MRRPREPHPWPRERRERGGSARQAWCGLIGMVVVGALLVIHARHMLRLHAAAAEERAGGGRLALWREEARDAWTGDASWPRDAFSPRPTPAPSTMRVATPVLAVRTPRPTLRPTPRPTPRPTVRPTLRPTPAPLPRPATPSPTPDRYVPRDTPDQTTPPPTPDRYAGAKVRTPDQGTPAPDRHAKAPKASRAVVAVETRSRVNSTRRAEHAEANALAQRTAVPCRARPTTNGTWLGVRVLVTGLSRSGSTWQYNAVKRMLEQYVERRGLDKEAYAVKGAHADGDAAAFDECLGSRICVLKTHIFVPRLVNQVDVILTSHRDVRDVVLSSMLMFGACFAPTGATRTQRSHGVALRFQQYAHWAPYVCYDGVYERMKLNYTNEVQRLARAVLSEDALLIDAAAVVKHVDELANRKPTSCQRGANSPKRGKHQPRKCWDAESGFGANHIHQATSKPKAYSKRIVLDEVQRRVPHCDVYLALRRVTEGFGGWLEAHGYDDGDDDLKEDADAALLLRGAFAEEVNTTKPVDTPVVVVEQQKDDEGEPDDDTSRRRLLFRKEMRHWGNAFVDTLPERSYVMDSRDFRKPTHGTPVAWPRFVHVTNPFYRSKPHDHSTIGGLEVNEDALAHAALSSAWRVATRSGIDVELVAAARHDDRDSMNILTRFPVRRACELSNGVQLAHGMRLPLLADLLACASLNEDADYVVLTNPDILVHPHFYVHLQQLVLDERRPLKTAWSITRRQIAPRAFATMDDIFRSKGEPHLGHDTLLIPRSWLSQLTAPTALTPGFSPWGGAFMASLAHVGRAVVLGSKRWTFHLAGDGVPPQTSSTEARRLVKEALLQKRTEVCENFEGTFFTTLESAAYLTATLQEDVVSRCCCGVNAASAPHGTIRLPAPSSSYALNFFSGPNKPRLKALGMQSYQYLWDRLGADVDLSRCAALPGIQLLPSSVISEEVNTWCASKPCPIRRNNSDCARARARPFFAKELVDDAQVSGAALTIFVAYEKLPTPYEGGHVRIRQILSWSCQSGHRVILAHRDAKAPPQFSQKWEAQPAKLVRDLNIDGCDDTNLAVFATSSDLKAVTAPRLAKQRVDVVIATTWFYRRDAAPIPLLLLPIVRELGSLRRRKVRLALLSDDVQYARAKSVAAARGDSINYWKNVREAERVLYGHPDVDVVLSISEDDAIAFEVVRNRAPEAAQAAFVGSELLTKESLLEPGFPPIRALPFRARIDPQTARKGWEAHFQTWAARKDLVFVGGGTYSNRKVVRWLLREALPAISTLQDNDGGCEELRSANLMLAGTVVWAEEARAACKDARAVNDGEQVQRLCASEVVKRGRPPHTSARVWAPGRLDNVGNVLRRSRVFAAPADVPSGISTKVWLALEHGLPIATTLDGSRGLPLTARTAASKGRPPFVGPISLEDSATHFAKAVAGTYCNASRWRADALAALQLAKDLESRAPWTGPDGPLADLVQGPAALACEAAPPPVNLETERAVAADLVGAVRGRFDAMLASAGGDCRALMATYD